MPKAADRKAVSVLGFEFTMVVIGQCRDVIEENARVDGGGWFKTPENDQRSFAIARFGEEFLQRVTESRNQLVLPVTDHEDDVGVDPLDHMVPADPVMTEDGVVVIFDKGARIRHHVMESAFQPGTGKFAGFNCRVKTDDPDFIFL